MTSSRGVFTSSNSQAVAEREAGLAETRSQAADRPSFGSIAFLVLVWSVTQFASIFSPPLLDDVDGIHMEAAKEMAQRHDYVTLYVDGIRYLDKPPLPYWLGALGIRMFGPHDWAVRITLALSVLALTLYLYAMGRRWYGERAGFYTACVFGTSVGPYIFTRFFIPDVMLALWMTIAADLTLRMTQEAERDGRSSWILSGLFGLVCTAAVLTKGMIGLVFPVGLLLIYLVVSGRTRLLLKLRPLVGAATFLVTALPWHILAAIENRASGDAKGWVWFYFVNEQINRYLNKRIPRDYDKVPLLTFWILLVVWLMPWGVFLAGAALRWWQTRRPLRLEGPRLLFGLWAVLVVGFFSFSTRQEYYTLPAVPALALLVGTYLAQEESEGTSKDAAWAKGGSGVLLAVGVVVALVCGYLAVAARTPAAGAELYQELVRHPEDYQLSFGHFFDLTTTAFGFFRAPLIGMAVSMAAMTGASFWLRAKGRKFASNMAVVLGMCAVLACVHQGLKTFYPILGSEPLAAAIRQRWHPGDKVVLDGEYSNGSSINFYLDEPVYLLNGRVNNLWYGSLYADAPHRFETTETFLSLWSGPRRMFFVTHDQGRTETWQQEHGGTVVAESSGKYVLVNHP